MPDLLAGLSGRHPDPARDPAPKSSLEIFQEAGFQHFVVAATTTDSLFSLSTHPIIGILIIDTAIDPEEYY